MKRIARGIRKFNEHVATAGNFAQTAARQIEEVRHTVANTTGQLQSLRAELPQWAGDLHAGSEERIAEAMAALNQSDEVFEQAGFAIGGIDLEISPAHRVIVHLIMIREIPPREIERLARSCPPGVQRAVLGALVKAREMGQTFAPEGLPDHRVQIALGPIPTVRLVWRNEGEESPTPAQNLGTSAPSGLPAAPASGSSTAFSSSLSQSPGGFFGSSTTIRLPQTPTPAPVETGSPSLSGNAAPAVASAAQPSDAPVDPLARFKVMPFKTR